MDVIMPQMGESIAEGTIVKWLKKPGDAVEKDEPLFEISTDKVDAEIPAPETGVLTEILVSEGNTVEVNTVVAKIGGEGAAAVSTAAPAEAPAPAPAATPPPAPAPAAPVPAPAPTPAPAPAADGGGIATLEDRVKTKSSPLVRKMAAEHGVDLTQVEGSGIHGRVTKQDMQAVLSGAAPVAAPAAPAAIPAVPAAAAPIPPAAPPPATRARTSSRTRRSAGQTSAHVQTFWEIDVANLAEIRAQAGDEFLARNGVKLSYTAFIAKATCDALKAVPIVNASISGSDVLYHGMVNLGIAVALEWGLIVPVVKNAGDMNLAGLSKSITDLAGRARSKKLSPDEVTGGTFTITNPGIFGGLFGCPIINQPQAAILGVGAIEKRPVVIDDAIAIRPMMYLSLSFDHRLIDGSVAEQFMGEIKKSLAAMTVAAL